MKRYVERRKVERPEFLELVFLLAPRIWRKMKDSYYSLCPNDESRRQKEGKRREDVVRLGTIQCIYLITTSEGKKQ